MQIKRNKFDIFDDIIFIILQFIIGIGGIISFIRFTKYLYGVM